ncbi:MAG: SDR family oxidoreductase [Opitutales bacterium]|nr:SDR family oxidoreductase [Opitutales bacterium]
MKIAILGGHGKIARHLQTLLLKDGHQVRSLIRQPDQEAAIQALGAEPVLFDIEKDQDLPAALGDAEAVVFAAGAGPGSGADRKWTVDRDGALKLIEAAEAKNIKRYLMISAMKVEEPRGNEVFQIYLQAKAEADAALRTSGLDFTIVRPGALLDEAGTGKVAIAPSLPSGKIPREDVAEVVRACLTNPSTIGVQFDLTSGDQSIPEALENLTGA